MNDAVIGRALKALRHRKRWRQSEVSARSGVARAIVGDFERGRISPHRLDALRAVARALGASIRTQLDWHGPDLARLLDADHAALADACARLLETVGWLVRPEVTFNHYGERGSIDLLAYHPATGILLVVEIKTALVDIQALLAGLDRKVRLAPALARDLGWARVSAVVPLLVVAEGTTTRRRLATHESLFARFAIRGRACRRWLGAPMPTAGVLSFAKLPRAHPGDRSQAARRRIRTATSEPRSRRASITGRNGPEGG